MVSVDIGTADEWADVVSSQIVPLGVVKTARTFSARVDRRDLCDDVRISRISAGSNVMQRSPSYISSTDDGFVLFQLNLAGHGRVIQHGRTCDLAGLMGTLYTTDEPSRFVLSAGYECQLVQLPRTVLPLSAAEIHRRVVRPISAADNSLLRVLAGVLTGTHDELARMDQVSRRSLTPIVVDLLASLLRAEESRHGDEPTTRLLAMKQFIREGHADPDLSVGRIAERFRMSERSVYKIFAEWGEHPAEAIRTVRLERARRLLLDSHATTDSIAGMCGFAAPSTFFRAFRRENGCSPSEWRKQRAADPHRASGPGTTGERVTGPAPSAQGRAGTPPN